LKTISCRRCRIAANGLDMQTQLIWKGRIVTAPSETVNGGLLPQRFRHNSEP
jgi:hypothetical protein